MAISLSSVNPFSGAKGDFFGIAGLLPRPVSKAAIRRLSGRLLTPDGEVADLGRGPEADLWEGLLRNGLPAEQAAERMILGARIKRTPFADLVKARMRLAPVRSVSDARAAKIREDQGLGGEMPVKLRPPRRDAENPDARLWTPPPPKEGYAPPVRIRKNPKLVGELLEDIRGRIWPSRHRGSAVPAAIASDYFRVECEILAHQLGDKDPSAPMPARGEARCAGAAAAGFRDGIAALRAETRDLPEPDQHGAFLAGVGRLHDEAIDCAKRHFRSKNMSDEGFDHAMSDALAALKRIWAEATGPAWVERLRASDPRFASSVTPAFAAGVAADIRERLELDRSAGLAEWTDGNATKLKSHLVDWSMEALGDHFGLVPEEAAGNRAVGNGRERASLLNGHTPREIRKRLTQEKAFGNGARIAAILEADPTRTLASAIAKACLVPSTGYRAYQFWLENDRADEAPSLAEVRGGGTGRFVPRKPAEPVQGELAATAEAAMLDPADVGAVLAEESSRAHRVAASRHDEATSAMLAGRETLRRLGLRPVEVSPTLLLAADGFLGDEDAKFRPSAWLDRLLEAGKNPGVRLGLEELAGADPSRAAEALALAQGHPPGSEEAADIFHAMAAAWRSLARMRAALCRPLKSRGNGLGGVPAFKRRFKPPAIASETGQWAAG